MKTRNEEILENIKKNDPRFKNIKIKPIGRIRIMRNILVYYDIEYRFKHSDYFYYWMSENKKLRLEKILKIQKKIKIKNNLK